MTRIVLWILAPALTISPLAAAAQSGGGSVGQIEGTVRDTAGKAMSTVLVRAVSTLTITDSAGHYRLANVPAGTTMVEAQSVALGAVGNGVATVVVPAGQSVVAPLTVRSLIVRGPKVNILHPSSLLFANPSISMPMVGLLLLFLVYARTRQTRTEQQSIPEPTIALAGPVLVFAWPSLMSWWGMIFYGSEEKLAGHIGWHAITLIVLGLCQPIVAWWALYRHPGTRRLIPLVLLAVWSFIWSGYTFLIAGMSIANDWL
jgi:hypothetical protein